MPLILQTLAFAAVLAVAISPRMGLAVLKTIILLYGLGLGPS
jgi:hypothetical protein